MRPGAALTLGARVRHRLNVSNPMAEPAFSRLRCVARAGFRSSLLAGLLVISAPSSEAQHPVQHVLVLQSFDRGNLVVDHFTGNFRVELDERAGTPRECRSGRRGSGRVRRRARTSDRRLHPIHLRRSSAADLIVTVAGPAAVFARKYRRSSFPTRRFCLRRSISGICATRHLATTKSLSRYRTTSLDISTTSCSCCPKPGRCSW